MTTRLPEEERARRAAMKGARSKYHCSRYKGGGATSQTKAHKGVIVVDAKCGLPYPITMREFQEKKQDYLSDPLITVYVDGRRIEWQPQLMEVK